MTRVLHILVCAASAVSIAVAAVVFGLRVWYPYELEWLEGWMLDSVRQILDGKPLYGPPSVEFVSSVYNPLYFYATAALTWPMGFGFAPARLVSVLSTFGIFALLVFRLNPDARAGGLVAAGLYAASYRFSGSWMDIARADSLFLFLILAAFLIGRDAKARWQDVICGAGYALAFFTKQTALVVLAVLFTGQLLIDWRRYWIQWVTFAAITAGVFAALDWSSDGWYSYYTLDSALHFVPNPDQYFFLAFARLKLLPGLQAMAVLVGWLAVRRWWPSLVGAAARERLELAMWTNNVFAVALVISSWVIFRQRGTFENVFMPACLGMAIGAGAAYGEFWRGISARQPLPGAPRDWSLVGFGAVVLLIVQQLTVFAYNPLGHIPRTADRVAGDRFISQLRDMPGTVLLWHHGYFGELAGKGRHVHDMAFTDAAGLESVPPRSENNRWRRQQVFDTIHAAVQRQDFDWIVIDRPSALWSPYYLQVDTIRDAPREFTGRMTQVGMVLTRNPIARGGRLDAADSRWDFLFGAGWGPSSPQGRSLIGEDASVVVALEAEPAYQLQIGVRIVCGEAAGRLTIVAWWNGRVIARKTPRECGEDQLTATVTPEMNDPELNRLRLSVVSEGSEEGAVGLRHVTFVASR